jgi:OmpA-OmpF porin, OOP family
MNTSIRTSIRVSNAKMISLLFVFVVLYSLTVSAQVGNIRQFKADATIKNAGKEINYAKNVNLEGKAVALNSSINSPYDDIKPAMTPCGKRLYFSRHLHPNNTTGTNDLEDIWFSDYDETSNEWSDPALLPGELNNAGPNYINNVSVTGDTVILGNQYKRNGKMRAGLSYSVNINGTWTFPQPINIFNDYNCSPQSNSYVSLNSGVIIRAVQRVETIGSRDLYVSFWDGVEATEPINMGGIINTEFEESSPFLAADHKTLYFASKGHNGHGGYDIYVTRRLDETWTNWSIPENLGPAVNGPMDDEFFSVTHCGNFAIFSKQVNVHNTDLFRISMSELFKDHDNITQPEQMKSAEPNVSAFASL